jgi:hypothetical protein
LIGLAITPLLCCIRPPQGDLHLADWASIAQIVLAITAVLALAGAIWQTHASGSATRASITFGFTTRFSSPEFLPYIGKTMELVKPSKDSAEVRFAAFHEMDREEQLAALVVPNLIEELAGMYNRGLLNKKITKDYFGDFARDLWVSGSWLFGSWREKDQEFFAQWYLMLKRMKLV